MPKVMLELIISFARFIGDGSVEQLVLSRRLSKTVVRCKIKLVMWYQAEVEYFLLTEFVGFRNILVVRKHGGLASLGATVNIGFEVVSPIHNLRRMTQTTVPNPAA